MKNREGMSKGKSRRKVQRVQRPFILKELTLDFAVLDEIDDDALLHARRGQWVKYCLAIHPDEARRRLNTLLPDDIAEFVFSLWRVQDTQELSRHFHYVELVHHSMTFLASCLDVLSHEGHRGYAFKTCDVIARNKTIGTPDAELAFAATRAKFLRLGHDVARTWAQWARYHLLSQGLLAA